MSLFNYRMVDRLCTRVGIYLEHVWFNYKTQKFNKCHITWWTLRYRGHVTVCLYCTHVYCTNI